MSLENVEKFEELLRSDEELQAKLRAATEAYQGEKENARAFFDMIVAPMAQSAGLPFTYDEGMEHLDLGRDLDGAELDAVAAGSFCYVIGGSDGGDAWACTTWDNGGGACIYVGISVAENDY